MMKFFFISICFLLAINQGFAQVKPPNSTTRTDSAIIIQDKYVPMAGYKEGNRKLAEFIQRKYDKIKHDPLSDSSFILEAFVGQRNLNELQDIRLIGGVKTPFSDFVAQTLQETGNSWVPMRQGGRAVKSFIRIHICLNNEGRIILSIKNSSD